MKKKTLRVERDVERERVKIIFLFFPNKTIRKSIPTDRDIMGKLLINFVLYCIFTCHVTFPLCLPPFGANSLNMSILQPTNILI